MNKIYKVVWSKVKHCYVVTSELAKRQTKGCGARSLRMATVSLGVAASLLCSGAVLPIFGESVAEAAVTVSDASDPLNNVTPEHGIVYYSYASAILGYEVYTIKGAATTDKELSITGSSNNSVSAQNGFVGCFDTLNNVTGSGASLSNGTVGALIGAGTVTANAEGSAVKVTGGTVDVGMYGGFSYSGAATGNSIEISGDNTVINSNAAGGTTDYSKVVGGSGKTGASNNTVTIKGGKINSYVYGGYSEDGVAGGSTADEGNTVNIAGGTVYKVYGGYTTGGAAETNHVIVDGGVVGVTATVFSGGQLYGAYSYNSSGNSGNVTGNTVTINEGIVMSDIYGGSTQAEGNGNQSGVATKNIVTINDGTLAGRDIYGGYSGAQYKTSGNVEGNQVIIKGGVLKSASVTINGTNLNTDGVRYIYGGYTYGYDKDTETGASGIAKDNVVTISGGALRSDVKVTGGESNANNAEHNMVNIESTFTGMVGEVTGGEANKNAIKNEVTIAGGTVSVVKGGYSSNGGIVGGENAADGNKVTINNATVGTVYGGHSYGSGSTGVVKNNTVTVIKGTVTGMVYGGYGWSSSRSASDKIGDVSNNKVEIIGGKVGAVYGGENSSGRPEQSGKAEENTVSVSGDAELTAGITGGDSVTIATNNHVNISGNSKVAGGVRGGYSRNSRTDYASAANATGNEVTISENAVLSSSVYGGYSNAGTAESNVVTFTGGTVNEATTRDFFTGLTGNDVTGGFSQSSGDVKKNIVTIEGGTVNAYRGVYGGWTKSGTAGGAGADDGNHVTVSGGTINKAIYGGYSQSGAVTGNMVSITGGTVSGYVYGGYGESGNPTKNSVIISGGTFNGRGSDQLILQQAIFGGYNHNDGSASDNTVTISGGTFIGSNGILIQGGRTYYATGTTNNNIVNLTGTVTGLEKGSLLGGGSNASNTGNELHVGGIKGGANGVWQGKTGDTVNNKVKYVANFDKVVLHSVKWDKDVAALEATTVENVGTLDITDLKFYTDAAGTTQKTSFEEGESMALLKSVESDLSSVKLDYKSGDAVVTGVAITTEGVTLGGGATDKTETDGVNGVKLTQSVTEKVKLATDSKAISYSCEVGDVKGVTFNASTPITFSKTEVARDLTGKTFAASNTINAEGLQFKETNEAIAVSDSMTLISNATGITTKVTNETGKTVAINNYEDSQKIKYNATASGTVTSDGSAVKYTVGSVTVSRIDLSGWTGTASDLTQGNTSGWTGAGVSVAGSFTAPDIAANSSQDIVITNKSGFFTVDAIDDSIKYAAVDFSDDEANGVTLAGSQSKGVQAVSDGTNDGAKLVYAVGKKDVTGITLGNMKVGDPRDMNTDYNFAGVTTLDASALTFDKPENVSANMNLVTNAAGITTGMDATAGKDHTQSFEQKAGNNVKLTATLKGTVTTDTSVVKYAYGGKELTKVDLKDWNGNEATFDATGWTKGASAAIETAGLSVTVDPGVEKTVLTVSGVDLTGITVNGEAYQWKNGGDSIAETSAKNGVKITAGETTGGGIKGDGNKIIYKGSSKKVTGLEVTNVDFVKDGVAREFKNDYDLTNAAITVASGITISNTEAMNTGDTMVVVDATDAIKVAGKEKQTLKDFTTINAGKAIDFADAIDGKALTLSGTHQDTLEQNGDKNQILYKVGDKNVNKATFTGEVAWNDSEAYYTNDASKYIFDTATAVDVDATNLKVTGTTDKALKRYDVMTLLSAQDMTAGTVTPQSEANKTASRITINYNDTASGIVFGAEATGAVKTEANAVKYEVEEITLKTVDLAGWNGNTAGVTDGWSAQPKSVAVNNADAITIVPATTKDIITAGSSMFADVNVEKTVDFDPVTQNGVTLTGTQKNVIKTNANNDTITYEVGKKDVKTVDIGTVEWGGEALDGSGTEYNYAGASVDHSGFGISNPEQVEVNTAMTLLKANETLAEMAEETKKTSYAYSPVSGVRIDAEILGNLEASDNKVTFIATENKASKLTFTNVEWKDIGALMTRPANITFAGADVDTAKINFHNIQELAANSRMTLVSDFGETVGTITGDTFTVGSGLQGEGAASLSGTDLVFTAKTGAESLTPTEATHETVMAMEAGTAVVAAGREYVDSAVEGLGLVSNMAPDGTSTFASMGGGVGRYKTGSHVDTHTWSAVVAVGSKREHKKGDLEWGVFAEYGRGNYTLHDDNGGRGDGNTHYAGGGLLAKWTNKHDVYTEASFRMGRMSDSASNMLRDVLGNTYGYDVHANYFGGHVGLGKIYKVKGNKDLDVYGKFFYTRRNGVDFDAGGNHYSLDSVASKLLRIGARYGSNDRKWNWYGGLAYEYEFGGESKGSVDGLAIRSASIKGASVRGEIGVRLEATKTNPWKADISIYGYGGKHRGIGGTVSVAYMF